MKKTITISVLLLQAIGYGFEQNHCDVEKILIPPQHIYLSVKKSEKLVYTGIFDRKYIYGYPYGTHHLYNKDGSIKKILLYSYFSDNPGACEGYDLIQKVYTFKKGKLVSYVSGNLCAGCEEWKPIGTWLFFQDGKLIKEVDTTLEENKNLTYIEKQYHLYFVKYDFKLKKWVTIKNNKRCGKL